MTAWETLTANSTIETGTAWEHFNAQGGGGGLTVILTDGIEVDTDMQDVIVYVEAEVELDVTVETAGIEVDLVMDMEVEV